jgi:hypothetical protein
MVAIQCFFFIFHYLNHYKSERLDSIDTHISLSLSKCESFLQLIEKSRWSPYGELFFFEFVHKKRRGSGYFISVEIDTNLFFLWFHF